MSKRFVVSEQRDRRMEFLGIAPAPSAAAAIDTVRRYAMRSSNVLMTAKELKVTKR